MSQNNIPEIPDELAAMLEDEEIENMKTLDGWSYGRVASVKGREIVDTFDAWIETLDGNGRSIGEFFGVRVHATDEEYFEDVASQHLPDQVPLESYAYANQKKFEESTKDDGYFVQEYTHGEEVTY